MEAYEGRVSQRGQITIPATLRGRFGLTPGVRVRFVLESDGINVQHVKSRLYEGFGAAKTHNYSEDWVACQEFEEFVAEDAITHGQRYAMTRY